MGAIRRWYRKGLRTAYLHKRVDERQASNPKRARRWNKWQERHPKTMGAALGALVAAPHALQAIRHHIDARDSLRVFGRDAFGDRAARNIHIGAGVGLGVLGGLATYHALKTHRRWRRKETRARRARRAQQASGVQLS